MAEFTQYSVSQTSRCFHFKYAHYIHELNMGTLPCVGVEGGSGVEGGPGVEGVEGGPCV